jgi:acetoin utilization deacetylase AcuC-like enzyme
MKVFYNDKYTAAQTAFDTTRKSSAVAQSLMEYPIKDVELKSPASICQHELSFAHDPYYVECVKKGMEPLASSAGFKWDEGFWDMVTASTGGVIEAAVEAMNNGVSGSLSSGLHHAKHNRGEGFCTFNGLAVAALTYALQGAKVLVLDLDAHCGGGTYDIVKDNKNIWQLDISTSEYDGYASDSNRHSLNFVNRGKDLGKIYLDTLNQELNKNTDFDLVLYNAGMDPYHYCDMGGIRDITKAVLREREQTVFDWCEAHSLPVAFVLAGGYVGPRLSEKSLVRLHRLTVEAACQRT